MALINYSPASQGHFLHIWLPLAPARCIVHPCVHSSHQLRTELCLYHCWHASCRLMPVHVTLCLHPIGCCVAWEPSGAPSVKAHASASTAARTCHHLRRGTRTSRAPAGHHFSAVTPLGSFLTIHHTGLCELGCCKNGCLPAPAIGAVAPLARRPSQACDMMRPV